MNRTDEMLANQIQSVVVLDTNAYRRLGRKRSDDEARRKGSGIAARDGVRHVQALMHPFVIIELAAHLADLADPEWHDCRAALLVAWEHCATVTPEAQRRLALMNDSETALCRVAYQQDPEGFAGVSERLATLCRRIATSDAETARTVGLPELQWWSARAAEIEEDFLSDMMEGLIHAHIPDATSWDALRRDPVARSEALEILDSDEFLPFMAEASVKKARRLLGIDGHDPDLKERAALVESVFRAPIELYRAVLRRVVSDGVDVSRTKYRNWIWDIHIAFSIGTFTVFGQKPVRFVSDDKMIIEAARNAKLGDKVWSFDQYSESLRS
jgi:hypothetical protein